MKYLTLSLTFIKILIINISIIPTMILIVTLLMNLIKIPITVTTTHPFSFLRKWILKKSWFLSKFYEIRRQWNQKKT